MPSTSARVLAAESTSPCWAVVIPRMALVVLEILTEPVMASLTLATAAVALLVTDSAVSRVSV